MGMFDYVNASPQTRAEDGSQFVCTCGELVLSMQTKDLDCTLRDVFIDEGGIAHFGGEAIVNRIDTIEVYGNCVDSDRRDEGHWNVFDVRLVRDHVASIKRRPVRP